MAAGPFFMDLTFKLISNQRLFALFGTVCAVCVYRALLTVGIDYLIQEFFKHLAVMHRRIAHCVTLHQLVGFVGIYMVFVAVVPLFILLRPTSINILLTPFGGLLVLRFGWLFRLDAGVLFSTVSLTWHFNKGGINHLPRTRHIAMHRQLLMKLRKQLINQVQLFQAFTKKPYRLGIRYPAFIPIRFLTSDSQVWKIGHRPNHLRITFELP